MDFPVSNLDASDIVWFCGQLFLAFVLGYGSGRLTNFTQRLFSAAADID